MESQPQNPEFMINPENFHPFTNGENQPANEYGPYYIENQ